MIARFEVAPAAIVCEPEGETLNPPVAAIELTCSGALPVFFKVTFFVRSVPTMVEPLSIARLSTEPRRFFCRGR